MKNPVSRLLAAMIVLQACMAAAAPGWQRQIRVVEPTSIGREAWPVLVRVERDGQDKGGHRLMVFRKGDDGLETPVPSQVMDVADPNMDSKGGANDLLEVCFQADLKPHSTNLFILKAGPGKSPSPKNPLAFESGGFGIKVNSGSAVFSFDHLSGQFCSYQPTLADFHSNITFRQIGRDRPCHWNPDVWVEGKAWGHTSDWNCERPELRPDLAISRGDLAFRMVRSGRMWSAENVAVTVTYTAFAGMPFLLESSAMTFMAPTVVKAIRHNELVFSRGFHTEALWPDEKGVPQTTPLYNKPDPKKFLGKVKTVPADSPWVGLVNDEKGYGIGVVNFWHKESTVDGSSPRSENSCYYFLDYGDHGTGDHYDWNFAYVCRPLYYNDKEPVLISTGAKYEEKSAFLAFALNPEGSGRYANLLRWVTLLREPPVVTVEQ